MENETPPLGWKQTLLYIVTWFVSVALLVWDLAVLRGWIRMFMVWVGGISAQGPLERFQMSGIIRFADKAFIFVMGFVGIGVVVFLEYYYRNGAAQGLLGRRIVRVMPVQLLIVALGTAIDALA